MAAEQSAGNEIRTMSDALKASLRGLGAAAIRRDAVTEELRKAEDAFSARETDVEASLTAALDDLEPMLRRGGGQPFGEMDDDGLLQWAGVLLAFSGLHGFQRETVRRMTDEAQAALAERLRLLGQAGTPVLGADRGRWVAGHTTECTSRPAMAQYFNEATIGVDCQAMNRHGTADRLVVPAQVVAARLEAPYLGTSHLYVGKAVIGGFFAGLYGDNLDRNIATPYPAGNPYAGERGQMLYTLAESGFIAADFADIPTQAVLEKIGQIMRQHVLKPGSWHYGRELLMIPPLFRNGEEAYAAALDVMEGSSVLPSTQPDVRTLVRADLEDLKRWALVGEGILVSDDAGLSDAVEYDLALRRLTPSPSWRLSTAGRL